MKDYFFIYEVKESEGFHIKVNTADLLYIKALGDYVQIITKTKHYTVHETLKNITQRLGSIMYRNHRSYSVNIHNIDLVSKQDVHIGRFEIPIGEQYRKELLNLLYN